MMSDEENNNIDDGSIFTDLIDQPLLIVPDEDDYDDEFENCDITITSSGNISLNHIEVQTIISNEELPTGEQSNVEVKNLIESNTTSQVVHRASESTKSIQTTVIDTSFTQEKQPRQTKTKSKCKNTSPSINLAIGSVLSYISFDKVSNILTVSRTGSIYYCVEDLYIKIFSSLCTLDEFTDLLIKPQILILKQVTLSEKISITQQNPKLKKFSHIRYRLIRIDSSDYLIKLKQLLTANKTKQIERIIDKMRCYKQTSTSIPLHNKVSTKRISTDDIQQEKRFKNTTNKQTLTESTNETMSSDNNLTECSLNKFELCSSPSIENIITNNLSSNTIPLHRSKSLIYNKEEMRKHLSRSYSLPSIKFNLEDNTMLKLRPNRTKSMDDNCSMPMIVNVEENVEVNNQKIQDSKQYLSYSQTPLTPPPQSSLYNSISPVLPPTRTPYPYLYQTPSYHLTPIRPPFNLDYQQYQSPSLLYQKSEESHFNHQSKMISSFDSSSNVRAPILTSLLDRSVSHPSLLSEQDTSPMPCYAPCCSHQLTTDQPSIRTNILPNERMNYREHLSPSLLKSNLSNLKSPSPMNRIQHQTPFAPYPPTKTYFAPLPIRYPSPQNSLMHETTYNTHGYCPKPPVFVPNSSTIMTPPNTPNGLRLPSVCTQSIDLSQAIIEHNHCNMDKIPKLVVRHRKTYSTKTIDTMGQLFPSWFNEPDYRCIHCFSCDQVFTPQLFMTHVDDAEMINEKPSNMTSIQLLTSEKMSEYKVGLWNEFCTNLIIYASKYAETEKKENSLKGGSNCGILSQQILLKSTNQEKNCPTLIAPVKSILTVNELL